jgi:DHA2 family multidrug resistance protein
MGNISLYNPEASERFYGLVKGFQSQGKTLQEAQQMATGAMEGILSTQAAIIGYAEGFLMIGIICACILPTIFFAKIKKGEVVDVGAAH